jgi:hypothetical protein
MTSRYLAPGARRLAVTVKDPRVGCGTSPEPIDGSRRTVE